MIELIKKAISKLPLSLQQEFKRIHFARNIKNNRFDGDEPEFFKLDSWIQEGDWVLDIGANVGHYSKRMSELVKQSGRVIAFEPMAETFELLAANVTRFPIRNISLFNMAVSDKPIVVGMEVPKEISGLNNYYMAHLTDNDSGFQVLCLPIDTFDFGRSIKLVKIDVEGHEISALKGMVNLIERDHPVLIIEGHTDEISSFLEKYGYTSTKFEKSPNTVFVREAL